MKKTTLISIALSLCMLVSCLTACGAGTHRDAALDVRQNTARTAEENPAGDPAKDMNEPDTPSEAQQTDTPAKEKTTLVIASIGGAKSKLNMVINEFNKHSEDYAVKLIDYAEDVSPEQGKMKLQTELISGSRPDMLLFDDEVYITSGNPANALSPLPCISSGTLLNLDEFVQNDPELNSGDFIIWDALHEFDGMYLIGPKFWVTALCGSQERAAQYKGWSLEDYLALQRTLGTEQDLIYNITPEIFIKRIASCYVHEVIDIRSATCNFDNPDFIALLEAACHVNSFSTEDKHMQADGSFKSAPEMLVDGELLFCKINLHSAADVSFDRWRAGGVRVWYGEGENPYQDIDPDGVTLAYIGYPTPDGSSGVYVEFPYSVGVCAGTEHPDACWEFIRYMLENPMYQNYADGTPVLRSKLKDNLDYIRKENLGWQTKQADLDQLVELAEECDKMGYFDLDILTIIQEEAAEVLAGAITAEQAAARVQNRASVLVMERYG